MLMATVCVTHNNVSTKNTNCEKTFFYCRAAVLYVKCFIFEVPHYETVVLYVVPKHLFTVKYHFNYDYKLGITCLYKALYQSNCETNKTNKCLTKHLRPRIMCLKNTEELNMEHCACLPFNWRLRE